MPRMRTVPVPQRVDEIATRRAEEACSDVDLQYRDDFNYRGNKYSACEGHYFADTHDVVLVSFNFCPRHSWTARRTRLGLKCWLARPSHGFELGA